MSYALQVLAQYNQFVVGYPQVDTCYGKVNSRKYESYLEVGKTRIPLPPNSKSMGNRYLSKM